MSLITVTYIFSVGNTIIASQHNANFSVIYNDYNGNITDANISSSADIGYTKLSLNNTIRNTDLLSTTVLSVANLGTGIANSSTFLRGDGAWNPSTGIYNYGSSASASTTPSAIIKICFGTISVNTNSDQNITNLPFTSSTSYSVTASSVSSNNAISTVIDSASQFHLHNNGSTVVINWMAIGT